MLLNCLDSGRPDSDSPFFFADELCSEQVFTTTFVEGVPVDKCVDMDEATRKHICYLVMQLCLRELFTFRYMQTDPNWSNFFYNPETRQVCGVPLNLIIQKHIHTTIQ